MKKYLVKSLIKVFSKRKKIYMEHHTTVKLLIISFFFFLFFHSWRNLPFGDHWWNSWSNTVSAPFKVSCWNIVYNPFKIHNCTQRDIFGGVKWLSILWLVLFVFYIQCSFDDVRSERLIYSGLDEFFHTFWFGWSLLTLLFEACSLRVVALKFICFIDPFLQNSDQCSRIKKYFLFIHLDQQMNLGRLY